MVVVFRFHVVLVVVNALLPERHVVVVYRMFALHVSQQLVVQQEQTAERLIMVVVFRFRVLLEVILQLEVFVLGKDRHVEFLHRIFVDVHQL